MSLSIGQNCGSSAHNKYNQFHFQYSRKFTFHVSILAQYVWFIKKEYQRRRVKKNVHFLLSPTAWRPFSKMNPPKLHLLETDRHDVKGDEETCCEGTIKCEEETRVPVGSKGEFSYRTVIQ